MFDTMLENARDVKSCIGLANFLPSRFGFPILHTSPTNPQKRISIGEIRCLRGEK